MPSSWGSGSPRGELAYRFLDRLAWRLGSDTPSRKLPVIERMLEDARFADFRETLLTMRAEARRQLALQDFRAPSSADVCTLLDHNEIASVEDLRALLVEQINEMETSDNRGFLDPNAASGPDLAMSARECRVSSPSAGRSGASARFRLHAGRLRLSSQHQRFML